MQRHLVRQNRFPYTSRKGLTLVELIVTLALAGLAIGMVFSFFTFQHQVFGRSMDKAQVQAEIRLASDFITKELRYASEIRLSEPTYPEDPSLFDRIYVDAGRIYHHAAGGTERGLTESVIIPQGLAFSIELSGSQYVLNYSIAGLAEQEDFAVDSSIVLSNAKQVQTVSGYEVYYRPVLAAVTPGGGSPTSSPTASPSPMITGTPTATPTASPTTTPTADPTPAPIPSVGINNESAIPQTLEVSAQLSFKPSIAKLRAFTVSLDEVESWQSYRVINGDRIELTASQTAGQVMSFDLLITDDDTGHVYRFSYSVISASKKGEK